MPEAHQPSIRTEFPKQLSPLGGEGGCCCLAMGQGSSSQVSLLLLLLQESEKLKSNLKKICLYTDRIPDFFLPLDCKVNLYLSLFIYLLSGTWRNSDQHPLSVWWSPGLTRQGRRLLTALLCIQMKIAAI